MYKLLRKGKNRYKLLDKNVLKVIDGFNLSSSRNVFKIAGFDISDIEVVAVDLAAPLARKKVKKKFDKLVELLTKLILEDDDSGDSYREALNHVEKFRLEIKIKYREYLLQKELEKMSDKLVAVKKTAMKRLQEIQNHYLEQVNNRSR